MEDLVLLHGFTQTGASWQPVRDLLPQRYRVWAPDIRGHGANSAARPIDFTTCVRDIEELEPEQFTLVGYSMGGRLALTFALQHPGRLKKLVLIGSSPGIEDEHERLKRREQDEQLATRLASGELSLEQFVEWWGSLPLFVTQTAAVREHAQRDRLKNSADGLAAALRGIGTGVMPPLWSQLSDLRVPVELIVGQQDKKFLVIAQQMSEQIPTCSLNVILGTGHAVQLEAPGKVANIISKA